jgi:UDPglucose 6-dehydrogenase
MKIANCFNTDSVEETIKNALSKNPNITIIIRSTVPVGFTDQMIERYQTNNIYFVPEFLREGRALNDSLNPSRIIIGGSGNKFKLIESIFRDGAKKKMLMFSILARLKQNHPNFFQTLIWRCELLSLMS